MRSLIRSLHVGHRPGWLAAHIRMVLPHEPVLHFVLRVARRAHSGLGGAIVHVFARAVSHAAVDAGREGAVADEAADYKCATDRAPVTIRLSGHSDRRRIAYRRHDPYRVLRSISDNNQFASDAQRRHEVQLNEQAEIPPCGCNTPERYVNGVVIHGTPDAVCDELARLREAMSLEYNLYAPLNHESFLLSTDKVLPRIGFSG